MILFFSYPTAHTLATLLMEGTLNNEHEPVNMVHDHRFVEMRDIHVGKL